MPKMSYAPIPFKAGLLSLQGAVHFPILNAVNTILYRLEVFTVGFFTSTCEYSEARINRQSGVEEITVPASGNHLRISLGADVSEILLRSRPCRFNDACSLDSSKTIGRTIG